MPLALLPPDPEPTEADLVPYRSIEAQGFDPERIARFFWHADQAHKHPDLFARPFWVGTQADKDNYHASELWRLIRERVLEAQRGRCAGCSGYATQVHHRDYRPRVLRGDDDGPLVALCRQCHDRVHFSGPSKHGDFRSWHDSERVLAELVAAKDARGRLKRRRRAVKRGSRCSAQPPA